MNALTVHQPWASLIAVGAKTIETRSWRPPASVVGERLVIHAGARKPDVGHALVVGQFQPRAGGAEDA